MDEVTSPLTQRSYTIKEVAALTGLPASALRYYEQIELLVAQDRRLAEELRDAARKQ